MMGADAEDTDASGLAASVAGEAAGAAEVADEALGAVEPDAPDFTSKGEPAAGLVSVLDELGVSGVG